MVEESVDTRVLLGTVAIEPNRWGLVREGPAGVVVLSEWLDRIARAGFDGIELWERHVTCVGPSELEQIVAHPIEVGVLNTYASWDDADPLIRDDAALRADLVGADSIKFNVGSDPSAEWDYVDRLRRFDDRVADGLRLLCECHDGTIAADPAVAARMFAAVAPCERLQAIVHLSRFVAPELEAFMDAIPDRVGHVHVQLSDVGPDADFCQVTDDLRVGVEFLRACNFDGTWTIEFSHGLMTERDEPAFILENAERDLRALRRAFEP